jgi:hypothetical protein
MKWSSIVLVTALVLAWASTKHLDSHVTSAALPQSTSRQTLDQYGGLMQLPCENKTGHFILTKVDSRWWFCTPSGHRFVSMSIGNVRPAGKGTLDCNHQSAYDFLVRKYGDVTYNWGWQTLRRMTAWDFNSVGQDSYGIVTPTYTCHGCAWPGGTVPIKLPYILEDKPAQYASVNVRGYASGYLKDIMNGVNGNYTAYRAMLPDVFDPTLGEWWHGELADHHLRDVTENSPWMLGVFTDDSDYFWGSGAGTDFPSYPSGHNNPNIGYLVMVTSPTQTYKQFTQYGHKTLLYTNTKVFAKANATNPAAQCSVSNPCSLRDYLWQKYGGDIGALNRAWGSRYVTFDSGGKQVSGEMIGTGNGETTVFTYKLLHAPISPNSLMISVGGTATAGDCAWFHPNCGASSDTGSIGSPNLDVLIQSSSSADYSTGKITITFAKPPKSGVAITADYIYGGWMAGGTGLMDESGSSPWIGNNSFCLQRSSSPYTVCVQGQRGAPNANPQIGADLDNWISQISAEYFKTMRTGLARYSSLPYLGLDTIGSWATPSSKFFLQGAAPYIDAAFVQLYADKPSADQASAMYSYLAQYLGDVPLMDFITLVAQPDSAESCHGVRDSFPTQQARGQEYFSTVQTFLSTPSFNKDYPWVGFGWWAWQDFQNANQGLVSVHDNAYDGVEATTSVGKDPWGYPTGGESANYEDCISLVKRANAVWYSLRP